MVRSIPEKTFEHWASMYVAHRFPRGGLWWPTVGEDIHVEDLGTLPGKSVLLETKVPELAPSGDHVITINLAQLTRYVASIVPVYYVFPQPPWVGDLMSSGWLGRERRADLAYRRAGPRWFGEWTVVCTAADLLAHLAPHQGQKTAVMAGTPPRHWQWFDFWTELIRCGSPEMPAAFVVPSDDWGHGSPRAGVEIQRSDLRRTLFGLRSELSNSREETRSSRRQADRERYVEEMRSAPKSVFVPSGRHDLYREVPGIEFDEVMRELVYLHDDESDPEGGAPDAHLAISAVPFDALALSTY